MAAPDPTAARWPGVASKAGHYESFYIKACHPAEPVGAWIRYTIHKPPDASPKGSLWFTLFDRSAAAPTASKVTLPDPQTGGGDWIRIGEARLGEGSASGSASSDAHEVDWELRFSSDEPPLFHLPRGWMYTAPLPRTKLLSPAPAARFEGTLRVDGRELAVDGWRGMIGHNWGAEHAERWIWMHGLVDNGGKPAWIDAALGRIKLGPWTTPWVGNGALSLDGTRHALGGPGRRVEVKETPEACEFTLPGKGVRIRGRVGAERKDFVGWVYADPDGPEHHTVNCSVADMNLIVERDGQGARQLDVVGGAAYELGMRERDHGVAIQPFPDG